MNTGPLKISLDGLDARSRNLLEMFLKGPAQGACEVVAEADAQAAIFDYDLYGAERLWQTLRGRFHGPAVVMSVIERHLHNAVWVKKPINTDDFLAAIAQVKERLRTEARLQELESVAETIIAPPVTERAPAAPVATPVPTPAKVPQPPPRGEQVEEGGVSRAAGLARQEQQIHECCGALSDEAYLDPRRESELFYEPNEYLQGVLEKACRLARTAAAPVKLEVLGQPLIVLPGGKQVFSDLREQVLRPLCVTSLANRQDEPQVQPGATVPAQKPQDSRFHGCEKMLWQVALWASRGRVPVGTDLDAPVVLPCWPNFSRILITPHAMQIAALWNERPLSLKETARRLAIPHRYVFAFYSACAALGLIDRQASSEPEVPEISKTVPEEKRGLLGSLLRKLKLGR